MHPLLTKFLTLVYPLPEKSLKRDRPLQILALGISRSGTESLRNALIEMDYYDVYHGFRFVIDISETRPWLRLAEARSTGNKSGLSATEFDKILGDCNAVTDQPCCGFSNELLDAYPEAKVIINYREDVEA